MSEPNKGEELPLSLVPLLMLVGGKGNNEFSRCKRRMRGRGADDKNSRQERLLTAKEGDTA